MEFKLDSLVFDASTIFTITKSISTNTIIIKFVSSDPTNIYYIKMNPIIDGTIRSDISLCDDINVFTINGKATKTFTKTYLIKMCGISTTSTLEFLIKFIKESNNAIDYINTTTKVGAGFPFNITLDNAAISYDSNYPTLTCDSKYVYSETTTGDVQKYLFPSGAIQPDTIPLKLNIEMSRALDGTTSKNYYGHTLIIDSPFKDSNNNLIFKNYGGARYFPQYSDSVVLTTNLTNPMKYIKDNKISINEEYLIGAYLEPSDYNVTTKLIGSYGIDGKEKSATTHNVKTRFVYAWQHLFDYTDSRIYWDNCSLQYWQTDGTQNLNVYLKSVADDNFKVNGSYVWNTLPWPKVQYKIKVFSQELTKVTTSNNFDTSLFNDTGYSTTLISNQIYLDYLWNTSIESISTYIHKETSATWYSQFDDTIVIDVTDGSFDNFRDNTEFHIYLITKDRLGFYQSIYFNKAINKDGYIKNSPDRTI